MGGEGMEPEKPKKDEPKKDEKAKKGGKDKDDKGGKDKGEKGKGKGKESADEEEEKPEPVLFESDLLEERTVRLTPASAPIASHVVSHDGETLLYLSQSGKSWALWAHRPRKDWTKRVSGVGKKDPKKLQLTKDDKTALVLDGEGKITRYDVSSFTGDDPS